jgi:hypothetical protein
MKPNRAEIITGSMIEFYYRRMRRNEFMDAFEGGDCGK